MFRLNTNSLLFVSISVMGSLLVILLSITVPISLVRSEEPNNNAGTFITSEQIQVTSVAELSDVQPTDWFFQAIQSLSERYGVGLGYPDMTFRGHSNIRRGEAAQWFQGMVQSVFDISPETDLQSLNLPTREDIENLIQSLENLASSLEDIQTRDFN